ncbi:helicase [Weissella confusa]|uniref:helicase-related protein n=1 Tax=Weissella confusa TaxID=1583 RepID=UPI0021C12405|nr:helicase-related protein [Weissella confusa]MCT8392979.1 helicase [Weissella confusa]
MAVPRMISNTGDNTVLNAVKEMVDKTSVVDIATAGMSIYALDALKSELKRSKKVNLMLTQPLKAPKLSDKTRQYEFNQDDGINGNEFEIALKNKMTTTSIARDLAQVIKEKLAIREVPQGSMQNLALIKNDNDGLYIPNFDLHADKLGMVKSNMVFPFSAMEMTIDEIEPMMDMFMQLWDNNSHDVTQSVLERLERLYEENTPEWLYFVTLYNIFHDQIDEITGESVIREGVDFKETKIWSLLYQFQKDGASGLIEKLEKYNGAILADSVGLGKTFSALAVIKYYEMRNDRVLVLAPKRLRENWTLYTQNDDRNPLVDDRFNYTVLNHTDLSRTSGMSGDVDLEHVNWGNYDLVVIDESHNFRNANDEGMSRYGRLMNKIIKSGVRTKVLLLSATPVNNRLTDIKNQIAFITEGRDDHLSQWGIESINTTLRLAQQSFNQWDKLPDEQRNTQTFQDLVNPDYFKLLDLLTIARSRKHIEKYYSTKNIGEFPHRLKPINMKPQLDKLSEFMPIEEVADLINGMMFAPYRPLSYILPNKRKQYNEMYSSDSDGDFAGRLTQEGRETAIANLIRVNYLKRLESSVYAFRLTLERTRANMKAMLERIVDAEKNPDNQRSISDFDQSENLFDDEEIDDLVIGNNTRKFFLGDIDLIAFKQAIEADVAVVTRILDSATQVSVERDNKLDELKELISTKIQHPLNGDNKKVIVFTAFADTARYLYDNLNEGLLERYGVKSALITGQDNQSNANISKKDMTSILLNFSPKSKGRTTGGDDIDILFATDTISEGQNLQDADYLVNYDIHWNPVRVIQRFGRIDRIGSTNKQIQLVNFWPNVELDDYINLESRVRNKMVLLNASATGEEDVLNDSGDKMNDLKYRQAQLESLQNEVLDMEDVNGAISITDLTYNDFKSDLKAALETYGDKLSDAPKGMYALTKSSLLDDAQPGVIFALRQTIDGIGRENSILPYILIYICNDGTAKYQYTQSKQILDAYKRLASGQNEVFNELLPSFNDETNEGIDMSFYTDLLTRAIDEIKGRRAEVGVASLFSDDISVMQTELFDELDDVELISFLIIREG